MKLNYFFLAGIGIFLWGLVTLDLFIGIAGVVIFLIAFLIGFARYRFKLSGAVNDDTIISAHKILLPQIKVIQGMLDASGLDMHNSKAKLATALFYMGMVDSASQGLHLTDKQFLNFGKWVFEDLNYLFEKTYFDKIFLFHQTGNTEHPANQAITKGGKMFIDFINGNKTVSLAAHIEIKELFENPKFPASIEAL